MKIAGREIGPSQPPYIVAELSCNHCGDITQAYKLIEHAKQSGADAVKLQAYTADTITLDCDREDFFLREGPWKGNRLYDLYSKTQTPFFWLQPLFEYAAKREITAFASVFDRSSVDALEKLDCPAYKIASMEITDTPLIKYAAATGKPLIISTGMASNQEIADAAVAVRGFNQVALLGCVSGYPTPLEEAGLGRFKEIHESSHRLMTVGISDHTKGWEVPVAATALGASIIEKHIGLWNNASEDAAFSLNPDEFKQMCEAVRAVWKAMQPSEAKSEEPSRQLRRSLYVVKDTRAGDIFTQDSIRSIRPGYGLPPKEIENVLGRQATCDIQKGTALHYNHILPLQKM